MAGLWLDRLLRLFVVIPDRTRGEGHAARRADLMRRQREIADALERSLRGYDARLASVARRLRASDDATFATEYEALRDEQARLRRLMTRLEFVERETPELLAEWKEWLATLAQGRPADAEVGERLELLRSELAVRGVEVVLPDLDGESEMEASTPSPASVGARFIAPNEVTEADSLGEWDEILEPLVGEATLAREDVEDGGDPVRLAELVREYRLHTAEQKRLDRRRGIRRDRLAAFPFVSR